jgi:hypothetical protein
MILAFVVDHSSAKVGAPSTSSARTISFPKKYSDLSHNRFQTVFGRESQRDSSFRPGLARHAAPQFDAGGSVYPGNRKKNSSTLKETPQKSERLSPTRREHLYFLKKRHSVSTRASKFFVKPDFCRGL